MGKHATDVQKIKFLTHLQYVSCRKAAQKAGLAPTTGKNLKARAAVLEIEHHEKGLPPPTLEQQIARKEGSGAKPKLSEEDCVKTFEACTLSKK